MWYYAAHLTDFSIVMSFVAHESLAEKIGAELDILRSDQAEYIGVKIEGPYKPEHYRY